MSIIVSVKINDGVVMASDSATTFYTQEGQPGQIYENADKIVNLVKGLPIGVMTCGSGGIANASVVTLLKDVRTQLAKEALNPSESGFDSTSYTMEQVAARVHEFFCQKATEADFKAYLLLRICGYSTGRPLPEVWQVSLDQGNCPPAWRVQAEDDIGPRWDGEYEALNRLIVGLGMRFNEAAIATGLTTPELVQEAYSKLVPYMGELLILPAAPIQDAIDLARFLVETTESFVKFSVSRSKTVGGPVEIAAITKHEGFKWIQRKHFYRAELNPIVPH